MALDASALKAAKKFALASITSGVSATGLGKEWRVAKVSALNDTGKPGASANRGNRQVVSYDAESKVVSNVVDRVHPGLVNIGVGALNPSVDVAALLLGRVDVLVTVGNVARLVLRLELAAGDRGNRSRLRIRQLGVLGVRGCVLGVDNWRRSTEFLVSCDWAGGEGSRSQCCHWGAIGKPGHN